MNIRTWMQAVRVHQWTKNGLLFAALLFALGDQTTDLPADAGIRVVLAFFFFCLSAGGVYLINDLKDVDRDREHPEKKKRPLASGQITAVQAKAAAGLCFLVGLGGAWFLHPLFGGLVSGYVLLQGVYTFYLKQIPLLDVFVIAVGFVLRALGGALVIDVPISPWLLLCTLMLAMFLALCKRRHEKVEEGETAGASRPMLQQYSVQLLDQLIAVVTSATITCYALYTLWPDTVSKYGSAKLGWTIPFVMFGLFRYLDLVYRERQGGKPEKILLTDAPILINLVLYGLTVFALFFMS